MERCVGKDKETIKVQEPKKFLSKAGKEVADKAFVETDKGLIKSKKEKQDAVIIGILEGKEGKGMPQTVTVDFAAPDRGSRYFLENAYAQNDYVPNKIISTLKAE